MNQPFLGPGISHSLAYRADVDGLRGLAILLVFLFHLGVKPLAGGFVGVDVFFMLSGYLITSILLADMDKGDFSLRRFYLRRVRRIIPALAAMAFICLLVAARFFGPHFFSAFGQSLRALVAFVSNLHFAGMGKGEGYFDPAPVPQPLLHTWSIAVEEQFYFIFPLTLLLLTRFLRGLRVWLLSAALVFSFAFSIWATSHETLHAFYLLPSRIWEFLTGALLTQGIVPRTRNAAVRELAAVAGLAAILFAAFSYTSATPFPGYTALPPCLGAALLLYAGTPGGRTPRTISLLKSPPFVFLGVISYSLYLWHWPIIAFTHYVLVTEESVAFTPLQMTLVLGLSLAAAMLSYRFVELPFRRRDTRIRTPQLLLLCGGAMVLLGLAAFAITQTAGLPQRFNASKRALIAANEAVELDLPFPQQNRCDNATYKPRRYPDAAFCQSGPKDHNILFWGDSQTVQLQTTLLKMERDGAWPRKGILFADYSGCPPTEHMTLLPGNFPCDDFARFTMQRALASDVDTVVMQFLPWWIYGSLCESNHGQCVRSLGKDEIVARLLQELTGHVEALKHAGKRVLLCLPFPDYQDDVPEFLIRDAVMGRLSLVRAPRLTYDAMRETEIDFAHKEGIEVFDPKKTLCPDGTCLYQRNGVSLYVDRSHLAGRNVGMISPSLLAATH